MKHKIGLFLDTEPFEGGAFQYSQTILEAVSALPRDRFDVVAALTNDSWSGQMKRHDLKALKVSFGFWKHFPGKRLSGYLPMTPWRKFARSFHAPSKFLNAQLCDLWIFPAQDIFTYLLPLPALGSIHDLMHRYEPQFPEVSAGGEYGKRERHYRHLCACAKGIVVDSEVGRKQVLESYRISPQRIHVLPYVARREIKKEEDSPLFDDRHPLPEKFIFYPAQFWQHKNHRVLILALALLREKIRDIHLVFTGTGKNGFTSLEKLIGDVKVSRHVTFSGYVSDADMACFYRRARAMMMPTFFGPTNIPPLEAMTNGCPTAVSDIYGMREQLGSASLYFNPSSAEEVAQVMEKLWCDDKLCDELSRQGLLRTSQWNQGHFNRMLSQILSEVLAPVNS